MIRISGIKYQDELERLPFFNKITASVLIGKEGKNLDKKLDRLIEIHYLKVLKKGMYVTDPYFGRVEKELYFEYIANVLREPSYISGEYVLSNEGLIPESVFSITSITRKTTRKYQNFLGSFIYKNIKSELFLGFIEKKWLDKTIYIASKAKALFDYFYLKRMDNIRTSVLDARINWDSFAGGDINEFGKYVKLSGSKKMLRVLKNIKENYVSF
ncbi:MAG: hypothetical protein UU32_C0004G0010 [Candidatus Woesebacteria bacterium GW2011_GWB1_41_10]|uniref:Uncharacterized protein n=1 Tax=Candidatus Woesebacteria bacterium GW2011_GWB1_41_10 TaxID=1618577 RepID=A0A0G0WT90_9BACT|nr:MAG: hypothetical protein UU32_C0004G0010 [Candidatus Woesebacteria bacterium GW2011_GWB1_41_10]KKS87952.1 MAG: hypothetical protein UV64_C0035G0002 [Parcubacteria group bacterium GW2011_GWC1_43_11b]